MVASTICWVCQERAAEVEHGLCTACINDGLRQRADYDWKHPVRADDHLAPGSLDPHTGTLAEGFHHGTDSNT